MKHILLIIFSFFIYSKFIHAQIVNQNSQKKNVLEFKKYVSIFQMKSLDEQLQAVNDLVNNSMNFEADTQDYWQTPFESMNRMKGDCEDYAILKYFLLRSLGIQAEFLRITYVIDVNQLGHMVLVYLNSSDLNKSIILDNVKPMAYVSSRPDYKIFYSFNEINFYEHLSMKALYPQNAEAYSAILKDLRSPKAQNFNHWH